MRLAPEALLRALADGEPHSGAELARGSVSRAAIWKTMQKLAHWGLDVRRCPASATAARPIDLLDVRARAARAANRSQARAARGVHGARFDEWPVARERAAAARARRASPNIRPRAVAGAAAVGSSARRGLRLSVGWQFRRAARSVRAHARVASSRAALADAARSTSRSSGRTTSRSTSGLGGILLELAAEARAAATSSRESASTSRCRPSPLAPSATAARRDRSRNRDARPPPRALIAAR